MRYAIIACLLLAACKTTPAVEVRTVEVVRETMRPCPVAKPVRPADLTALPDDARDAVLVLYAKLLEYAGPGGYADQADKAIGVCVGSP